MMTQFRDAYIDPALGGNELTNIDLDVWHHMASLGPSVLGFRSVVLLWVPSLDVPAFYVSTDWYILSCALFSRPLKVKNRPTFGLPEGFRPGKREGAKGRGQGQDFQGGPRNRKIWRELSPEDREHLKQAMGEVRDGFNRVLMDMPKALFLILRSVWCCILSRRVVGQAGWMWWNRYKLTEMGHNLETSALVVQNSFWPGPIFMEF